MAFAIETLVNRVLKAGAFVSVESFVVVDEDGAPVVAKTFNTKEEAQAQIDGLGNLSIGIEFAKACFPEQADKALKGKAAIIAAYLDWEAAGRPVKTVEEKAAEEAQAEPTPEADLSEAETF